MTIDRRIRGVLGISLLAVVAVMSGCAGEGDPRPVGEAASSDGPSGVAFFAPTVGGVRVDYCLHFAADCGQPAADAFCVRSGFQSAASYSVQYGLGHTVILGDPGSECVNPGCGGFAVISCQ